MKTCTSVNLVTQSKKRVFEKDKSEYTFRTINSIINSLNLYEAQFTSRLGMLLADQISQGNENFELQLEPETFGKVRVNVSLENSNVEVKMIADIIDATFWMKQFAGNKEEVSEVKNSCEVAGI